MVLKFKMKRYILARMFPVSDRRGVVLFRPPRLTNKFEDGSVKFDEDKFTSNKIKRFIQDNM